jgi:hypothetical protein
MRITHFMQYRTTTTVTWVLAYLFLLQPCIPVLAQAQDDCTAKLKEAEQLFYNGDFDKSVALIKDCLSKPDFPTSKEKDAYELLAQNYLAKSYLSDARSAIKKLLALVPNYVPPADSPDLVAEVAKVKKEMSEEQKPVETPVAQQNTPAEESTFPKTWHWIAGGAVVTGVVLALVLKGSNNETAPAATPLPGPPAMP